MAILIFSPNSQKQHLVCDEKNKSFCLCQTLFKINSKYGRFCIRVKLIITLMPRDYCNFLNLSEKSEGKFFTVRMVTQNVNKLETGITSFRYVPHEQSWKTGKYKKKDH